MDRTTHLIITILACAFLCAIGTVGYMLIEDWSMLESLYMTVITFSTVGFGEIRPLSSVGRVFTLILIVLGVGFVAYVIGNVIQFLVEGRIRLILGRHKLDKKIDRLNNHYIVCGYGRMGRALCGYLTQKHLQFVVIEKNSDRIPIMNEDGTLYVSGEATDEANLNKAGIKRASNLIATLGTDADNVFLVLVARGLNPMLYVVARASKNAIKKPLYSAGANVVVSSLDVGARRMAHAILRPNVIRFLELAFDDEDTDINIEEMKVGASSPLVDIPLKDSEIRNNYDLIILSIGKADGTMLFNPSGDTRIVAGDTVLAVGCNDSLVKLGEVLDP